MITVEEAELLVQKHLPDWGASLDSIESTSSFESLLPLKSDRAYPPFDRVMMDGIAVNFTRYDQGLRSFPLKGVAAAGTPPLALTDVNCAIEVMTGAPLPIGTDLVIPYEHIQIQNEIAHISLDIVRSRMENIHHEGSDCRSGEVVSPAGSTFNGAFAGIAASMGYSRIQSKRKPKILIISTGNELVEIHETPAAHQIRRSNAYALKASLAINGLIDCQLHHLNDDPKLIAEHYKKNKSEFDILIYSGGVSKGKFDYLPSVWADMGVHQYFHEVTQRPGKPLWFGVDHNHQTAVLGLPGNPVSSLVCLHRYLLKNRNVYAELSEEISFKKDLTYFVPVKICFSQEAKLIASPLPIKNSGEFTALSGSDGFLELPRERSLFKRGESFLFFPWRNFL
jgi:molybdopterin molybdotransferase